MQLKVGAVYACMPKILVTGSEGFVGRAIVKALEASHPDFQIVGLDKAALYQEIGKKSERPLSTLPADVRHFEEVERAFADAKPDVVVHTAGVVPQLPVRYTGYGRAAVHDVNVNGTANIIKACQDFGVKILVYTSTCCVVTDDQTRAYPNFDETTPIPSKSSTYGETKAEAEALVLAADSASLSTCALRPPVIFGEDDYQLIPTLHACIAKGETKFQIGENDNLYDFMYVCNVADAHVLALDNLLSSKTAAGQAILISNGEPVTFRDLCLAVWAGFGHVPPQTIRIPASVAWFGGLVSEYRTWSSCTPATLSRGSVNDAIGTRYANIAKARKILGFEPRISLAAAVSISAEAYQKRTADMESTLPLSNGKP